MLTFAYYLLKIIICSGILYGYYLIALRDKIFHKWNRFYLLAAVVLSLAAPLIKINIWQKSDEPKTQVIHFLQVVNSNDEIVYEYTKNNSYFKMNASDLAAFIYVITSGFLLAFLIQTLYKINRLKNKYQQTVLAGINFINTDANGTPFSFFNNIFWNDKIDINTQTGKQIFRHEVVHVQEKHSYDKIFINIILIFFWINPFFWLIRKELNIIHEFIADKKALEDSDTAAFAAMILQATYPQQQFTITNNFFYSPLKRRLLMLTKNKNPKISYASRLLVLPLAALVFFAFAIKMKTISSINNYTGKKITVAIDAGHGGDDKGISANNIYEKDLALSIAKEIKDLNKNDKINIILSRETDKNISVKDRVIFSKANNADLFVSIHVDGEVNKNTHSGLSVLIPKDNNAYLKESKLLGTDILESFRTNYQLQIPNDLKQPDHGVWILNANQCPAVLIETGFLTTQKDFEYLTKNENQKTIAQNILTGIEKYAMQNLLIQNKKILIQDTVPVENNNTVIIKPKKALYHGINIIKAEMKSDNIITLSLANGKTVEISKDDAVNLGFTIFTPPVIIKNQEALIFVDGIEKGRNKTILNSIAPKSIQTISVLKGEEAIKKYGNKGKDGVIEITTKRQVISMNNSIPKNSDLKKENENVAIYDSTGNPIGYKNINPKMTDDEVRQVPIIFTKVEVPPAFPGGEQAWTRYMTKIIKENIDELANENKSGTCHVKFIVNTDGTVSDVHVTTMEGTALAKVALNAIKKGPKWVPAMQNGHIVAAYRDQPITFTIQQN